MEKSYIIHTFNPKANERFETIFSKSEQRKNNTVRPYNSSSKEEKKKVLRTGRRSIGIKFLLYLV
jgi:hypothetical protein